MPRSLNGADGVVAHKPWFKNAFRNILCERPPRLRGLRWLSDFLLTAQPPLLTRRGIRLLEHAGQFHAFIDGRYRSAVVPISLSHATGARGQSGRRLLSIRSATPSMYASMNQRPFSAAARAMPTIRALSKSPKRSSFASASELVLT